MDWDLLTDSNLFLYVSSRTKGAVVEPSEFSSGSHLFFQPVEYYEQTAFSKHKGHHETKMIGQIMTENMVCRENPTK